MYIQLEHSSFVLVPQRHNAVPAATVLVRPRLEGVAAAAQI